MKRAITPTFPMTEISRLGEPSGEYVSQRLEELMRLHARNGELDEASLDRLAPMDRGKFMAVVAMALLLGMGRWPEIEEAAPGAPGAFH
jgi:hypothetical protein